MPGDASDTAHVPRGPNFRKRLGFLFNVRNFQFSHKLGQLLTKIAQLFCFGQTVLFLKSYRSCVGNDQFLFHV